MVQFGLKNRNNCDFFNLKGVPKLFKRIKQNKLRNCASNYTLIKILDIKEYLLWLYRLLSFQGTKLDRFLHKNQHTLRKLLNFENWTTLQIYTVFNCVHFPLLSCCTVYIFCHIQSNVQVTFKKL